MMKGVCTPLSRYQSLIDQYNEMAHLPNDLQTRYNYQYEKIRKEMYEKIERENFKKEIINEIMSRIDVLLETKAIDKLNDMINKLGK